MRTVALSCSRDSQKCRRRSKRKQTYNHLLALLNDNPTLGPTFQTVGSGLLPQSLLVNLQCLLAALLPSVHNVASRSSGFKRCHYNKSPVVMLRIY